MKILLTLIFCLLLNACASSGQVDSNTQRYGAKTSYQSRNEIKFPDFSLTFTGRREIGYPNKDSPRKMRFYDFEVIKGETKQKISWSSGSGDVAPTLFESGGSQYVLELGQSDIQGTLGEGNLIVWKKSDYDEAVKNKVKSTGS